MGFAKADTGFLVDQQLGQATGDSCQSYAIGVAMAFKNDPNFPIRNYVELRNFENKLRARIVELANGEKVGHNHIISAVSDVTSSTYRLVRKEVDLQGLLDLIAARTGVTDEAAVSLNFLLGAYVNDVILSSAGKIGGSKYGSGHIFAVLGRSGPPDSNMKFLVLNSGVKVQDDATSPKQNVCKDGIPDQGSSYWGSLSWRSDIDWKKFGPNKDKYLVFLLEKN
jgi:hypothetical protein